MAKVMLVEDDLLSIQIVSEILRAEGHEVIPFNDGTAALAAVESLVPEIVITDLNLGKAGPTGMDILKRARALNPPPIVIVITGYGSFEIAVEATKLGAFDYLQKPFKAVELRLKLWKALSHSEVVSENAYLRKELKRKYQFSQIIGSAPPMQQVFRMVERVADTESTVLLRGESGTGKELIAKALHFNSRRGAAPFVPINCSALPEHLLESELFGHRKGAFTGAIADKKGLFQEADGGTIFLDEIGSMSPVLQSRLLRVLQEREVRAVGDNVSVYVNVRVIAATNEPLEELIKKGGFREDLYYRLNVISIPMPALRERLDDLPLLVSHFLRRKAADRGLHPSASAAARWSRCTRTRGRATCASWRMPSSAPVRCARKASSSSTTCRRSFTRWEKLISPTPRSRSHPAATPPCSLRRSNLRTAGRPHLCRAH